MARVSEIRYVGYGVPDLEAERRFYLDVWRLREVTHQDDKVYLATEGDDEPYVVRLRAASIKRIDVIGLAAATRADVDTLFTRVQNAGCQIIFAPGPLSGPSKGYGFQFFSPDGLPFEVSSDVTPGPSSTVREREGIPRKISHIVLHSPNHHAAVKFFTEVLGFRISDWLGDFMCFLRCNRAHHRLAVLPGPACLDHVAYDMLSVDDMMRGVRRLKQAGSDVRWGPGRHTAGNNIFSYFASPNEFTVEYTAELANVDDDTHQPTVHVPSPQIMDQWGIGVGGPHTMPQARPDAGLFKLPES